MSPPVAEFVATSKTYRSALQFRHAIEALHDVHLTIQSGEVFALLGPNRAGKTTLLKILLGLCRPTSGEARRFGKPLSDRTTLARIGYMHENQAFPRYLSARALLRLYGKLGWVPASSLNASIPALLERVGLADRADEPIARFSKGMVQRLALAQALLAKPDLLVLDEPLEGLDLGARQTLHETIREQRQAGKSVLLVSHALEEIASVCDRAAVLVNGRLAHVGPVRDLVRDPQTGAARSLESALAPIYRGGATGASRP
jgi:ABC-2 type transport system ATP-binding protein